MCTIITEHTTREKEKKLLKTSCLPRSNQSQSTQKKKWLLFMYLPYFWCYAKWKRHVQCKCVKIEKAKINLVGAVKTEETQLHFFYFFKFIVREINRTVSLFIQQKLIFEENSIRARAFSKNSLTPFIQIYCFRHDVFVRLSF